MAIAVAAKKSWPLIVLHRLNRSGSGVRLHGLRHTVGNQSSSTAIPAASSLSGSSPHRGQASTLRCSTHQSLQCLEPLYGQQVTRPQRYRHDANSSHSNLNTDHTLKAAFLSAKQSKASSATRHPKILHLSAHSPSKHNSLTASFPAYILLRITHFRLHLSLTLLFPTILGGRQPVGLLIGIFLCIVALCLHVDQTCEVRTYIYLQIRCRLFAVSYNC